MLKGLPDRNVRVRLSKGFRSDLAWWQNFAQYFNGVSAIIDSSSQEYVYTDASMEGYGVVHGSDWVGFFF